MNIWELMDTSRWWSRFGHIMSNMLAVTFAFAYVCSFSWQKRLTLKISNLKPAGDSMMAGSLDSNPEKACMF